MERCIFISGGSGGIGRAVCRRLIELGRQPIIGYRSDKEELRRFSARFDVPIIKLDFDDDVTIAEAVEELDAKCFAVDGIVFAASPPPTIGPYGRIAEADMLRQWRANVLGPQQFLGKILKRDFRPAKMGFAVAVLSQAVNEDSSSGQMGAYVIAKFGLMGVLRAAHAEFPWLKIGDVRPGFTETGMLEAFDKRYLDDMRAKDPRGRFSSADEVAGEITALIGKFG